LSIQVTGIEDIMPDLERAALTKAIKKLGGKLTYDRKPGRPIFEISFRDYGWSSDPGPSAGFKNLGLPKFLGQGLQTERDSASR
jgi:hypothetical protein